MDIQNQDSALQRVGKLPEEQRTQVIEGATELVLMHIIERIGPELSDPELDVLDGLNDSEDTKPDDVLAALRGILKEHQLDLDVLASEAAVQVDQDLTRKMVEMPREDQIQPPVNGGE